VTRTTTRRLIKYIHTPILVEAISNFKPNFYDLLLLDITMPIMNGFELCEKVLILDLNIGVCFITAGEIDQEAIRELRPLRTIGGCFIQKLVEMGHLIRQLISELIRQKPY
jgi:CheY-like chemotaxis protein